MSEQFQQPAPEMDNNKRHAEFSDGASDGSEVEPEADNTFNDAERSPYTFDDNDVTDDQTSYPEDELIIPEQSKEELPPEARGELNGGPLGCCMGVTIGILICFTIGLVGLGQVTASVLATLIHADPLTEIRVATGFFALIGALIGGYAGWKIGKRVYREYEVSTRQQERLVRLNEKALQRTQLKQGSSNGQVRVAGHRKGCPYPHLALVLKNIISLDRFDSHAIMKLPQETFPHLCLMGSSTCCPCTQACFLRTPFPSLINFDNPFLSRSYMPIETQSLGKRCPCHCRGRACSCPPGRAQQCPVRRQRWGRLFCLLTPGDEGRGKPGPYRRSTRYK